jgi:uncharacterized coiled-coil DUF342 family protein
MGKSVQFEVIEEMVAKLRATEDELDNQLSRAADWRARADEMDATTEKTRARCVEWRESLADTYQSLGLPIPDELKPRSKQ